MTEASVAKSIYKYDGQNREGLLCLRGNKEVLLVSGTLYAKSAPTKPKTDKSKVVLVALKTTPSYVKALDDRRFSVVTATGESLHVMGQVVKTQPLTIFVIKRRIMQPVTSPIPYEKTAIATVVSGGKKPTSDELLDQEIIRVNALLKLGHDPEVRMKYVSHFIGQSEGNLYKKIKTKTFPEPYTKPGGGAHWKHSRLIAYQAETGLPKAKRLRKEQ